MPAEQRALSVTAGFQRGNHALSNIANVQHIEILVDGTRNFAAQQTWYQAQLPIVDVPRPPAHSWIDDHRAHATARRRHYQIFDALLEREIWMEAHGKTRSPILHSVVWLLQRGK